MYVRLSLSLLGLKATATITKPTMFTFKNLYFMPKLMLEKLFWTVFLNQLDFSQNLYVFAKNVISYYYFKRVSGPFEVLSLNIGFQGCKLQS